MLRVGRCIYDKSGKRTDPSYPGFTPILVLTKSASEWGVIGPYELWDEKGRNMENIWQAAKVYKNVPKRKNYYSRYSKTVIWEHPDETHIDPVTNKPNDAYWKWRDKLEKNKHAVRYPVGFDHRHNCQYALAELPDGKYSGPLNYVEGRKAIYLPVYTTLVKRTAKFKELQDRLKKGENLLIIEVDAPHQESLEHYKKTYGVDDNFIQQSTMVINEDNIKIMLNDPKHPFGHGYCLAMALLDKEQEWNK